MQRRTKGQKHSLDRPKIVLDHERFNGNTSEIKPSRKKCKSSGKVKWKSEEDAKGVLLKARVSYSARRMEVRCYKCPDCTGWHLTKKA